MTEFERDLKKYKKQTKKLLFVKTDASVSFLRELRNNIEDYACAQNVTDISKIIERFGAPAQIAKEFFAQTDIEAARKKVSVKRALIAVLLAALLIWGAAVSALYIEARNDMNGRYEEQIEISEVD